MRPGPGRTRGMATLAAAAGAAALGWMATAAAHTGGGAYVLLLPTSLYVAGGALAVTASFAVVALVPPERLARAAGWRWRVATMSPAIVDRLSIVASLLSLATVTVLVVAGLTGSRDPLDNPLPPTVWAVWWIGFTGLHAVAGNVWALVNPWHGLHRMARAGEAPPLSYPVRAASWPAVALFLGFAWFELIHPSPADPTVLARVVAGYGLLQFAGLFLFGPVWLERAEPFGLFFRMVSWLAPVGLAEARTRVPADGDLERRRGAHEGDRLPAGGADGRRAVAIRLPAASLLRVDLPDASRTVFVLLALSSVSFDGLSRTFTWLGALGVNPLEYPGRTALAVPDTLGLLGVLGTFALGYAAAMALASRLAGPGAGVGRLARLFVLSLVPIVCGYHLAHYLPVLLVDSQHALVAASDPFERGWNLLGTSHLAVVTSFLTDADRVYTIWHTQVTLIVGAHIVAVLAAHGLTARAGPGMARLGSQLPLLALMIGYTVLGLWLLSTPAAS